MNIRKAVDYSTMFATLESVMKADLPQMELYCEIGKHCAVIHSLSDIHSFSFPAHSA